MSTANTAKTTAAKEVTNEQIIEMLSQMQNGMTEVLQKQDLMAKTVGEFDGRLKNVEGTATKQAAAETLEAAVEAGKEVKAGVLGKFKQASTGKKVVIATATTAVVAGVGYGAYKGYEMYQGRQAVKEGDIVDVQSLGTAITPAKQDAIRQGLSLNK